MNQRSCTAAATLILASLVACSSASMREPVAADGSALDGGTGGHPASADACGGNSPCSECRGTLEEVGQGCPATFDGAPENVPACKHFGVQQLWTCGDVIALSLGTGAYSVDCYYDASSHGLRGAMEVNDTNTLCGNSFTKTAGEVPPLTCRFPVIMPILYRVCLGADAGTN